MNIADCYKIGFVLKPHGLKGEVTIAFDEDIPNDVSSIDAVFLEIRGSLVPYFVETISARGPKAYVKFEDVDSIEAAEEIAKTSIYLPKAARPKSGKGEFYDDEITGFAVTDETAGDIGKVIEVTSAGPNRLLAVDFQGREILIPLNGPFITSVNKSRKKISVNLPDGFLDI